MNLNGTYKINIEQSAKRQVLGLAAITQRLAGSVGLDIIEEPRMEQPIRELIAMFQENQAIIDMIRIKIEDNYITVCSDEDEMVYHVLGRQDDGTGGIIFRLKNEETGPISWDVTLCGNFLLIDGTDELSEYVLEKE